MELLVTRWNPTMLRLARQLTGDLEAAREACQAAWLAVLERGGTFRRGARFSTWMYSVVVNQCRDRARSESARARRERIASTDRNSTSEASSSPAERGDTAALVTAALERLPENEREVVVLRHYHDMPLARISDVLGVPVTTLRARLLRGLQHLRPHLMDLRGPETE